MWRFGLGFGDFRFDSTVSIEHISVIEAQSLVKGGEVYMQ